MSDSFRQCDLDRALTDLSADRDAMPWGERRALAAFAAEQLNRTERRSVALALFRVLAADPKWEVRKEVAASLPLLPDDEFVPLAAKLTSDSNGFVRKAAERSLDRRKRGLSQAGPRRRGLSQVLSEIDELGRRNGNRVANKVRQLVDQLYDAMAGTTVHELRGVLTPLIAAASRLREKALRRPLAPGDFDGDLETIATGLELFERFIDDMRAYSQTVPTERTPVQLDKVVAEAHQLARDRLEATNQGLDCLDVSISVDQRLTICVARHSVLAAVRNVLTNAYEAALAQDERVERRIRLQAVLVEGVEVRIVVSDSGIGMCNEDLREVRAFIPGRTSKKGNGTGFGLPIAQRAMTAHGGWISIESVENEGTTVTMTLPVDAFSEGGK